MQIMLMAQCYAPENVSAAVLITELATDLVNMGHKVTIATGAPSYPYGRVFDGYSNRLYSTEILDGVRVIRTWSYISPAKKILPRLLHYGTYSLTAFYGGLFAGKPDVLVSFSPPLPLGFSAWLLSRIWRVPWVLQLEDLYPDAAIVAGMISNPRLITFFYAMEKFLYRRASFISVIAQTFQRMLLAKGVSASKVKVIPIWADPNEVKPLPRQNMFRQKHGLNEKFVVLYAGNLGLTSCLEDVLQAAEILQGKPEIQFVLVGEGVKKVSLETFAQARNLENVCFLPYQPREQFPEMLAAADINLVTLAPGAALTSLPSKIFNAMASMRPVLAVTPLDSELAQLIAKSNCGWIVPPAAPEQLADAIVQLEAKTQLLEEMSQNGRTYLKKYHTRVLCVDIFEKMLIRLFQQADIKNRL
jgi:colanic acid biosynthesis glycosyl transferase WcaI